MNDTLLLATAAAILIGWGIMIFALASRDCNCGAGDDYGALCAPRRYDAYTAQPAAAPRHILAELAPPAEWRDVMHVALVSAPAAQYDDPDGGDELPLAVTDWPTPAVVEPEAVPVVVNRTAARFGALELKGGA